MLNKYPLWKNLVIVFALVIGFIYALPNFFPDDYAIQITGARGSTEVDERVGHVAFSKGTGRYGRVRFVLGAPSGRARSR